MILYRTKTPDSGQKFIFTRSPLHTGHWVANHDYENSAKIEVFAGFDYMTEDEVEKKFGFYEPEGELGWQLGKYGTM